jgi:methionyl-tRNA formyltransferase
MKNIILADGLVGLQICNWLFEHYREDIGLVVVTGENEIKNAATGADIPCSVFSSETELLQYVQQADVDYDWGFLLWWPKIVSRSLIKIPRNGFVNTHPSLLPFNRGKHYNFWALVEQTPFGVSLHYVEEGIDCGDIIAQFPISYDWEDTGLSLYEKAINTMTDLFVNTYPIFNDQEVSCRKQELSKGSCHLAKELDAVSCIELDKRYRARDLLNLLRARTFPGHPACYFYDDNGEEFEIRVEIRRKNK